MFRGSVGKEGSGGWARWAQQHLHEPDDESVAADQRDRKDGEQADHEKDEQASFLAFHGAALGRGSHSLFSVAFAIESRP